MTGEQPEALTVRSISAVCVEVPMTHVLGTSAAIVRTAPLLLVDLETEEGITGRSYLFCYLPSAGPAIVCMLGEIARIVKGERLAPLDLWARLARRFTLIGVEGIVRMAMSAVDIACWDALAIAAGKPLAAFLGATPARISAYNSCGLGLMQPEQLADEAEGLLEGGYRAVKLRLGYATLEQDMAAVHAVRRRVGSSIAGMTDFNQALSVQEAIRRGHALDAEGVYWIEEPIRHDDFAGAARIARELRTPLQIGENFSLVFDMHKALAAGACDYVMPDLERIGGVSGWLRAAAIAAAHGIEMSSHLFPEVSAHLLCATPTAHWLEYVDWANAIVTEPLIIRGGEAIVPDRPGNGLLWDAQAVQRYRVN